MIDRSPHPTATAQTAEKLRAAIAEYNALELQKAKDALDAVRGEIDANGAAGLSPALLSDLFVYRGLASAKLGDESGSLDDLVAAARVDPTRALDPVAFTPKVAPRSSVQGGGRPRRPVKLTVQAPGLRRQRRRGLAPGAVELAVGPHWIRVTCPDRGRSASRSS